MEDINKYLGEGATAEEREAAEEVLAGLQALRLQEKVTIAAAARQQLARARWWRLFGGALTLLLLSGGLAWWWSTPPRKEEINVPSSPATETQRQQEAIELSPAPTTTEANETDLPQEQIQTPPVPRATPEAPAPAPEKVEPPALPIAEAKLPPPPYPAPLASVRGSNSEADAQQALLNQVWYTDYPLRGLPLEGTAWEALDNLLRNRSFPQAYVQLQRLDRQLGANDTLQYLRAYTLLEMGQGDSAQQLFTQLSKGPVSWQAQIRWYQVLSLLVANDEEEAVSIARELARQTQHPYQAEAAKVLSLWTEE